MNGYSCLTRKCPVCGEIIPITINTIGELISFEKKTYHRDCFANLCKKNSSPESRKKDKKKWSDALNNVDQIRKKSIADFQPLIIRDSIYRLIIKHYNPTIVPEYIFIKCNEIFNGTYKNMTRRIPPKHLLDMWERKMKELHEMHKRMERDGKSMDVTQEISYDISVLINKYDSYLKWLEKQRILEVEEDRQRADSASIQSIVDKNTIKNNETNENSVDIDIAALVDEIFD